MSEEKAVGRSSRRGFLTASGSVGLGATIALTGAGSAQTGSGQDVAAGGLQQEKDGLVTLGDRPTNAETPPHLLDDRVTPADRIFVRNNGLPPAIESINPVTWELNVAGLVNTPLKLSIADLKRDFDVVTLQLQMECAGNGRRYFTPGASGNQWTFGAIACPQWTGVRLADVLRAAGVKESAIYTAHYGADTHLSGDPAKEPISRGIPIEKAMDPHNLIAWAINDEEMPLVNGHPLRLVVPGWPGSCSQKWLTRIELIDREHDGAKMTGKSYRVPAYPVAPGTDVPDEDMQIIGSHPVKSLITSPRTGSQIPPRQKTQITGHAWAGDREVSAVDVSIDFGRTWIAAELEAPANRYAWQHWSAAIVPPQAGYFEVWARATDSEGEMQPATTPGWNPKGYLNNMQHRIAVYAV
ncbi:MAG: sulfite oxidase [Pseudomonadota bacterium]